MLHRLATSAYDAAPLTTAECAASLLLAMRLFSSCSACCRIKALRCVGPAKCCCSSAMLLNVACSIETLMHTMHSCSFSSEAAKKSERTGALTLLFTEVRPGDDQIRVPDRERSDAPGARSCQLQLQMTLMHELAAVRRWHLVTGGCLLSYVRSQVQHRRLLLSAAIGQSIGNTIAAAVVYCANYIPLVVLGLCFFACPCFALSS